MPVAKGNMPGRPSSRRKRSDSARSSGSGSATRGSLRPLGVTATGPCQSVRLPAARSHAICPATPPASGRIVDQAGRDPRVLADLAQLAGRPVVVGPNLVGDLGQIGAPPVGDEYALFCVAEDVGYFEHFRRRVAQTRAKIGEQAVEPRVPGRFLQWRGKSLSLSQFAQKVPHLSDRPLRPHPGRPCSVPPGLRRAAAGPSAAACRHRTRGF